MIVKETITISGAEYDYTYSDKRYMIERDGILYVDAIDPLNSNRHYIETDIPIEVDPEDNIDANN